MSVRSERGQFYIISCITILMALLVMESMIREHRPLKRDDFSLMPIFFFQNSRQQGSKIVDASCTQASVRDSVCSDIMTQNLNDYMFFMQRTANELGFSWNGEITYTTTSSWNLVPATEALTYRIPVEVVANYPMNEVQVSEVIPLPLMTDFATDIWMVGMGTDVPRGDTVEYNVICTLESGIVAQNSMMPHSDCIIESSWKVNFTWTVSQLKPFQPQRFYIYFNTTTGGEGL